MSDLTPADLARLRLLLAPLPTLDPLGLLISGDDGPCGICVRAEAPDYWVARGVRDIARIYFPEDLVIDLANASTRDRVARWVAGRHPRFRLGSTAPSWTSVVTRGGHTESIGWLLSEEATASDHHFNRDLYCPDLDVNDDRLLPDGSRWVDAAALTDVARHVGARP